ncbi:MAG TPA: portal protein, partial [Vicinamibacterales bacterium]|nr:portal protein [Vicinamibacterales bacterium]
RMRLVLSDGSRVWEDELETERGRGEGGRFTKAPKLPAGVTVRRKVPKVTKKVHWCLINAMGEKLDSTIIPGEYIPVVRIYGERRNIDGKVDYRGMVRMAKDPSRMEDFCESSLMETIAIAKTAPWLAEWDQISEFKAIWETSNRVNYAVLPYKRVAGENGAPIPPPQRITAGVDVSALTLAAQRMQNHVRNVTGQQDVFQDETAAQQANLSGRAMNVRRQIQELGTSDYLENLGDGIVLTAKIIMSMARDGVYDTPRVLRILGEDEKEHEIVTYFGDEQAEQARQLQTKEIEDLFDITVGEYDIAISMGRNHLTARRETVDILSDLVPQLPPQIQAKAFPILIKSLDGPGARELAAALEPDQKGVSPEVLQKLEEADQLMQMMQARIKQLEGEQAMEKVKGELQLALQEMKGMQQMMLQALKGQQARTVQDDAQSHDAAMHAADAAHTDRQADRQDLRILAGRAGDVPVGGKPNGRTS